MERGDLTELGYITAIANLPSICELGILCFRNLLPLPWVV
jgi:hypothetical protein